MIESWLQYTCDGCGETEYSPDSNITRAKVREELATYGWKHFAGGLDYCPKCVKRGIAAERYTGMNA